MEEVKGKLVDSWGQSIVGERNGRCKALEAETCLAHSRTSKDNSRRSRVREEEREAM